MKTNTIKSVLLLIISLFSITTIAQAEDKTLASGKWTGKSNSIAGSWKIVDEGDVVKLKLYSLKTTSAPDLKIFFHTKPIAQVTNDNATQGSKFFAKLASNKGNQSYVLPKWFKITDYKSIIIHCEKYTKLWGGADLK